MANRVLSDQELAQIAYNAGFRGNDLLTAVAIAKAESGGNPNAYNPETAAGTAAGSGSRGLWQIYGSAHPQYNNTGAFDPQTNANAAFQVYKEAGGRFTPWSTFNIGSFKQYLTGNIKTPTAPAFGNGINIGASAAPGIPGPASSPAVRSVQTGLQTSATAGNLPAPSALGFLGTFLTGKAAEDTAGIKTDVTNLGFIGAGAVFIILGLVLFFIVGLRSQAGGVIADTIKSSVGG